MHTGQLGWSFDVRRSFGPDVPFKVACAFWKIERRKENVWLFLYISCDFKSGDVRCIDITY